MIRPALVALGIALALPLSPVTAQPAAEPPADPAERAETAPETAPETGTEADRPAIVVEGERRERRKKMRTFTEAVTRPPRYAKPLARFLEPVCPLVWGMKAAYADVVRARMIEILDQMDIRNYGARDCRPNLYVLFASDVDEGMRQIVEETTMLKELHDYEVDRVLNETGPVRAFSLAGLRDKRGQPLKMSAFGPVNDSAESSRLRHQVTLETVGAFVAIDVDALDGKTLQQLADYAALRGLTQVDPARGADLSTFDTILTLFEAGESAPPELSAFDRAYLRTLYNYPNDLHPADLYQRIAMNFERAETRDSAADDAPATGEDDAP